MLIIVNIYKFISILPLTLLPFFALALIWAVKSMNLTAWIVKLQLEILSLVLYVVKMIMEIQVSLSYSFSIFMILLWVWNISTSSINIRDIRKTQE